MLSSLKEFRFLSLDENEDENALTETDKIEADGSAQSTNPGESWGI